MFDIVRNDYKSSIGLEYRYLKWFRRAQKMMSLAVCITLVHIDTAVYKANIVFHSLVN